METELFVHFAEIAGVFVGFGALISLRSERLTDLHDVIYLRAVLGLGVWVVISALIPIAVNRYGVHDRALWFSCGVFALTLWAVLLLTTNLTADSRSFNRTAAERIDRYFPVVGLPLHVIIAGSLLLLIVNVWPGTDEALYVSALTAAVVFAGYTLLALVMSQKHEPDRNAQ